MKTRLTTILALGGLLAIAPALTAQDKPKGDKPAKPEGAPAAAGERRPGGPEAIKERVEKISEELKLSADQKTKVEAALKAQGEKMREMRDLAPEERREKAQGLREETQKKMKEILTPEQYEKWSKMPQGPANRRGGANRPEGQPNRAERKTEKS